MTEVTTLSEEVAEVVRPVRVQLRRMKGWRMPENTVSVARPGPFGNPFRIGVSYQVRDEELAGDIIGETYIANASAAVAAFGSWVEEGLGEAAVASLRGKNLACWCPLNQPCHADVLLELANPSLTASAGGE